HSIVMRMSGLAQGERLGLFQILIGQQSVLQQFYVTCRAMVSCIVASNFFDCGTSRPLRCNSATLASCAARRRSLSATKALARGRHFSDHQLGMSARVSQTMS